MSDWITIRSDALTAAINPLGAELSSLTDAAGRELMTDADPAFWTGRAPILFPIVGEAAGGVIRVDGRDYPMKRHGFARRRAFAVTAQDDASATFELAADDETRAQYPFDFRLRVTIALDGTTLTTIAEIANPAADRDLPASIGFHPGFAWPLPYGAPRDAHRITFAADEPEALLALTPEGLVAPGERASPLVDARILPLADALFTQDALIWGGVRSDRVLYDADGAASLEVAFPDTPMLGIWTKPGARFVCIEPWHGLADRDGFIGEYRDKPGVFTVPPGGTARVGWSVTLRQP